MYEDFEEEDLYVQCWAKPQLDEEEEEVVLDSLLAQYCLSAGSSLV